MTHFQKQAYFLLNYYKFAKAKPSYRNSYTNLVEFVAGGWKCAHWCAVECELNTIIAALIDDYDSFR